MPSLRLLTNLLLVLALVASGPLPAFAGEYEQPRAAAPCHGDGADGQMDNDVHPPAPAETHADADCCGGEPGYCGCDCLQHAAATLVRATRSPQPAPGALEIIEAGPSILAAPATPRTRPPIA